MLFTDPPTSRLHVFARKSTGPNKRRTEPSAGREGIKDGIVAIETQNCKHIRLMSFSGRHDRRLATGKERPNTVESVTSYWTWMIAALPVQKARWCSDKNHKRSREEVACCPCSAAACLQSPNRKPSWKRSPISRRKNHPRRNHRSKTSMRSLTNR